MKEKLEKRKINVLKNSLQLQIMSICAVLCSLIILAVSQSAHAANCPAWNPAVSYMPSTIPAVNYPVQYTDGKIYAAKWYTEIGQAPDPNFTDGNPWAKADASACANIPEPGIASIAWMKNKYESGESVLLHWDMWSGNPSLTWHVLDNDENVVFSGVTTRAKGSQASGDATLKLADGMHVLKIKLCTHDSCSVGPEVGIIVGDNLAPRPFTINTPQISQSCKV